MAKLLALLLLSLLIIDNSYAVDPAIYVFLGGGPAKDYTQDLQNPSIVGAQIVYSWRKLEPSEGHYDFTAVSQDLAYLTSIHKKLFIQIQDRSFDPTVIPVPDYIVKDKVYSGGIAQQVDFAGEDQPLGTGWVAMQWVPAVQQRYQALLGALAQQFDGKIAGINLPETAIDPESNATANQFSCDKYFDATLANINFLRKAFKAGYVVQYVNFFPCEWNNDHHYMSRLFQSAKQEKVGLGNPDVVPYRKGQMKNSYQFFNQYRNQLPIVEVAVQEPDYTYIDPATHQKFSMQQVADFAKNYLGATIIFWNVQEPQFSKKFLPLLNHKQLFNVRDQDG